ALRDEEARAGRRLAPPGPCRVRGRAEPAAVDAVRAEPVVQLGGAAGRHPFARRGPCRLGGGGPGRRASRAVRGGGRRGVPADRPPTRPGPAAPFAPRDRGLPCGLRPGLDPRLVRRSGARPPRPRLWSPHTLTV